MTDPRDFGHMSDLERDYFGYHGWSNDSTGWALGAIVALLLLGGIAVYSFSGDHPRTVNVPADETTGQSTRPPIVPDSPMVLPMPRP
jgi:hypothetical protein